MAKLIITMNGGGRQEIPLNCERLTIGRAAHNDVVIDHPGVSAEHAAIVGHGAYLQDLGSTNGTRVNGQPVMRHFLQDKDVIDLAGHEIRFFSEAVKAPTDFPVIAGELSAVLKVLNGAYAGKQFVLAKALTTLGRPGLGVAAIVNDANGYRLIHVEGKAFPLLNGEFIGESIRLLTYDDVIDLSGTQIMFCQGGAKV